MTDWLSLSNAATLIGVHPNTLRRWSDEGRIPSHRTPGGHRRFARGTLLQLGTPAGQASRVLADGPALPPPWRTRFGEAGLQEIRELGQRLLGLLLQYISRQEEDPRYLEEGRAVGRVYGAEAALAGLTMLQVVEAFHHFRTRFSDLALRLPTDPQSSDEVALRRIHQRFDHFMNQVLLGTVEGFEGDDMIGQSSLSSYDS